MSDLPTVRVKFLPPCDLCTMESHERPGHLIREAAYDGKTVMGPWAYMCEPHFRTWGVGLGRGEGQSLEVESDG